MQLITSYPWYYFLLCILCGLSYSLLLYFKDKKNGDRSNFFVLGLASLRFLSVSIITLLLLDIFLKRLINEVEKPMIIIAQDNSSSIISGKDSLSYKIDYTKALNSFINGVKEKYEVRTYKFDSDFKSSESFDFKGKETDISTVFLSIENNYANKNIGAIVLATDGIYNKGSNPIYGISKINAPVYPIALGDTTPLKDLFIQSINHNQVAYLGNSFPVEVLVNAIDLKDKKTTLNYFSKWKIN